MKTNTPTTAIEIALKRFKEWQEGLQKYEDQNCRICAITPYHLAIHLKEFESQIKHSLIKEIREKLPEKKKGGKFSQEIPVEARQYDCDVVAYNLALDEVNEILREIPRRINKLITQQQEELLEKIIRNNLDLKFRLAEIICGGTNVCYEHGQQLEAIAQAIKEELFQDLTKKGEK